MRVDFEKDPVGYSSEGKPVYYENGGILHYLGRRMLREARETAMP